MSDQHPEPDDRLTELTISEAGDVRVLWVKGSTMQALVDRVAVALQEHMRDHDELHVTYSSMQSGWTQRPGRPGSLLRDGVAPYTELSFEYSAFIVLRHQPATNTTPNDAT